MGGTPASTAAEADDARSGSAGPADADSGGALRPARAGNNARTGDTTDDR